jgi:hypothetical protein
MSRDPQRRAPSTSPGCAAALSLAMTARATRPSGSARGSGYSAALIAELLLKAAGHYDVILAEAAAAGPLD